MQLPHPPAGEGEREATVATALRAAAARLAASGVPEPRLDARLLLAEALGAEPAAVFGWPERRLGAAERERFAGLVERRARREPVSRILGRREFWSLPFRVVPATLDPRPDSETLVEAALAEFADVSAPLRVLDFGTGTGCLLLAFLSERPSATGIGVDLAPAALACARANAAALGLGGRARFVASDWDAALAGTADVILANPPYIEAGAIAALDPEVALHDPRRALDGGADGLDAYRALAVGTARLLAPEGQAFLELGQGQAAAVAALMTAAGLAVRAIRRDLAGEERCLVVSRSP
jgi:release factor glutamine methyltransferase